MKKEREMSEQPMSTADINKVLVTQVRRLTERLGIKDNALTLMGKALGNLRAHADRYCDCPIVPDNDTHAALQPPPSTDKPENSR